MTPEQAKACFTEALQGSLSAREQAQFEQALDADSSLAREFEAFSDGHAAGLADVDRWLVRATGAQTDPDSAVYASRMLQILEGTSTRKRGRLLRLAGAIGAVAAAAAIVAVLLIPGGTTPETAPETQQWHTGAGVELMADGQRLYGQSVSEFVPAPGVKLSLAQGALVQPLTDGLRLSGGSVKVSLAAGSHYNIFIGARRIEAKGPAEFDVRATPLQFDTLSFLNDSYLNPEQDPMFNTRMVARFGATGFLFTVSMLAGNAAVHGDGPTQTLAAPQVLQAEAKPEKPHKAPKPEDAFAHLDKNSDGKLDSTEVEQKLIDDFDDDKSGDVDLTEFKAHFKPMPPKPPTADDEFKRLDKNADGKLDAEETDARMLKDFDDDNSGDVSLDEFKAHFRPRRMPPSPEDEFKRLDKNSDGKLDAEETEKRMIDDFDDDNSGDIDEAEFKKHFKPRPPRGPGPGGEGPGREGDKPPRGEGPGREGPGRGNRPGPK